MADEVRLFGGLSAYGLFIGTVYWFLSYEPVGTALLLGFGLTTGVGFVLLFRRDRKQRVLLAAALQRGEVDPGPRPDPPFGDESGPVPTHSAAPLAVGFGLAIVGLCAAFGPWFLITGIVPLLIGAGAWLRSANHELDQRSAADGVPPYPRGG